MATREEDVVVPIITNTSPEDTSHSNSSPEMNTELIPAFNPDVSVLHIEAWGIEYSHTRPHVTPFSSGSSGSGFVVMHLDETYIVTNAHVAEAERLTVKFPRGDNTKYEATIISIDSSCDLALLKVDNVAFNERAVPIPLLERSPKIDDCIEVHGFPMGGKTVSKTRGTVSRVENQHNYAHSNIQLPVAQLTAAIAPGNSGGPVICNNMLIGVAFQGIRGVEGSGQIIPVSIVKHFLMHNKMIGDVHHSSFPELNIKTSKLNSLTKTSLGLASTTTGLKVKSVPSLSCSGTLLQENDILTHIDGIQIHDDATVMLEDGMFEPYDVLIKRKHIGDTVSISFIRGNTSHACDITLNKAHGANDLVPLIPNYIQPNFYWDSGLLFQTLTKNFLSSTYSNTAKIKKYRNISRDEDNEEVVFISSIIPKSYAQDADGNNIYNDDAKDYKNMKISHVNGTKIKTLADLIITMQNTTSASIKLTLDDDDADDLEIPKASHLENLMLMREFSIAELCSSSYNRFIREISFADVPEMCLFHNSLTQLEILEEVSPPAPPPTPSDVEADREEIIDGSEPNSPNQVDSEAELDGTHIDHSNVEETGAVVNNTIMTGEQNIMLPASNLFQFQQHLDTHPTTKRSRAGATTIASSSEDKPNTAKKRRFIE